MVETFVEYVFSYNGAVNYIIATGVFLLSFGVLKIIQKIVIHRFESYIKLSDTKIDDSILNIVRTIKPPFYWFLAFYIALQFLDLEGFVRRSVDVILVAWVTYQVIVALQIFLVYFIRIRFVRKDERSGEVVANILSTVSRIVLWSVGVLFVLQNVGVNVTSLIAGLGIGGIAIALALQRILEDLFSSLAIYFDRPFEPGDFIVVGDTSGTVQKVGVKTTRIKALSGEEVTVPNKEITSSRIQNYRRMKSRRVAFLLGVTYETSQEHLKKIPDIISSIITDTPNAEFDRCHFVEFGDFALLFDIVYHIDSRDYTVYVDTHQRILLGIKEAFEKEGINIAFPTQTIHVKQ